MKNWIKHIELLLLGYRIDRNIWLVNKILREQQLDARVYRKAFGVILLYKGKTVSFDAYPMFMSNDDIIKHHTKAIQDLKDKVTSK